MEIYEIREKIVFELQKLGIFVDETDDFNLREYIDDSLIFISFMVQVEETFDISFDDEDLIYGSLASINAFCNIVKRNSRKKIIAPNCFLIMKEEKPYERTENRK